MDIKEKLVFAYIFLRLSLEFICRIISIKEKTAPKKPGKHIRKR